jgi:acyl-CoA synthetase (AMP-forming)/AMP-acid ligase II
MKRTGIGKSAEIALSVMGGIAVDKKGITISQIFGQTEASTITSLSPDDAILKIGSVGLPVFHGEVRIVDKTGKDALETWGVKYVLLVGGLKSLIWGNPRENINYGAKDWRVPVRYANLLDNDPGGYISDLYYADIYKQGGVFDNLSLTSSKLRDWHKGSAAKTDRPLQTTSSLVLGTISGSV